MRRENRSPRWASLTAVGLMATLGGVAQAGAPGARPPSDAELHPFAEMLLSRPRHLSHQGGALTWPENTLVAYRNAVAQARTDVLDLDVRLSRDGVPVVIHDSTVDRTTDGSGYVHAMDLADLKALDAGYDFTLDGVTYPWRGTGVTIPTLEEVIALIADPEALDGARPFLNIEIKVPSPALEQAVAELIEGYDVADRLCIGSFFGYGGRDLKERIPEACVWYPTGAGLCEGLDAVLDAELGGCPDYDVLEIPAASFAAPLGEKVVAQAHRDGIPVVVWTVNDEDEMADLLEIGVDGILTDLPLTLRRVMDEAGYPPSADLGY